MIRMSGASQPPGSRRAEPISTSRPVGEVIERQVGESVLVPLAVSPRRAAAYLGVGHDAVYRLLNEGRLRSVKLGRRRLIPVSELERFLEAEIS
jgi:excisionase family DNA binding protein